MEGKTQVGNYLLKGVKGKGKEKVRNTAIPPNQLKRFTARSQNIPAKSDDEYASESDGDDNQGLPIDTNSPVSSDADTILYADSEDDKGIPGHSSGVPILGCTSSDETIEIEIGQIPGCKSSSDSDDTIEIDVVREIPGCTAHGYTMEAAEILATLAAGGDPDWLPDLTVPEEPESPLEVLVALAEEAVAEIPDDTRAATSAIPGHTNVLILGHTSEQSPTIIESSSSNSPMFDDATSEEMDIDLLIHGVTSPEPIKFRPLTLFCRKPAGLQLGVQVGRKSGLRQVKLAFTGKRLNCSENFIEHNILGDGNCFFRVISYLLLGQKVKHDVIRARIPEHYPSGEAYIQGEAMADLNTWATEVELFACAQLSGKDVVCYCHRRWLRYPPSGNPRKPTRNSLFISNKRGNHFNPVIGMQ